ncbi:acetyltransferase [Cupriavidus pinatubonensis]|uniref:acetyltransferase n=1 Tax=Cupriavidus pinatubonensis TaxID=248026 RepID=UPI0011264BBB|nr:acetyltransferase [Cupriavidus pinatubonensis]TPQ42763.1 acetyltransferase [Cupriavidus pinatubonensis]
MTHFDVFNGDADGICALHQLRLANPIASSLITGVKRDVTLLARVPARQGDAVTVLDISLDTNREALLELLGRGVAVEYFDHHFFGSIPLHPGLMACIETAPTVCTSLLVNRHLGGKHALWAIVGAFGDNLSDAAHQLARGHFLRAGQTHQLRELGESINYNAYGDAEADLRIPPARLYEALLPYADPFQFIVAAPITRALHDGRRQDMEMAMQQRASIALPCGAIYVLPDLAWARRVRGVFSNHLASSHPRLAHAVLTVNAHGGYTVSVRAPMASPYGADKLCRQFESGGGREAAAGINCLARDRLPHFMHAFEEVFSVGGAAQNASS